MDYINSTSSSIYGTLPRTKKREKSKREKRTPEDMASRIAKYVVYKAEHVSFINYSSIINYSFYSDRLDFRFVF